MLDFENDQDHKNMIFRDEYHTAFHLASYIDTVAGLWKVIMTVKVP